MVGASDLAVLDDPRPDDIRRALDRVVLRWRQLSLDRAGRLSVTVRGCAARCAGLAPERIPDLGPATAADQLAVTVYDACAAGRTADLTRWLTDLLARMG